MQLTKHTKSVIVAIKVGSKEEMTIKDLLCTQMKSEERRGVGKGNVRMYIFIV